MFRISSLWLLSVLIGLHILQCTAFDGSGSGVLDTDSDTDADTEIEGSGSSTTASSIKPTIRSTTRAHTTALVDDEDGDVGVYLAGTSGATPDNLETGSGTLETTSRTTSLPANMRCSDYYCWCIDSAGNERLGSMFLRSQRLPDCSSTTTTTTSSTTSSTSRVTSTPTSTSTSSTIRPSTTEKQRPPIRIVTEIVDGPVFTTKKSTTRPVATIPYQVIGGGNEDDVTDKMGSNGPATVKKPQDIPGAAGDTNGLSGDDDGGVDREPAPESSLFSHPGILAAIIGGGVVALLSALLLIMFIIYRMRKKDEGSYPLDPDAKPPRLHTYTRAPNKEFYA